MVDSEKMDDVLFLQLLIGLHGSAWMLLGKVANPVTGGVERNLEAAKATIDTLAMLKAKTLGNLSKEEEDYLSNILQQLQLNYVDEVGKGSAEKEEKPAEETSTPKEEKKKDSSDEEEKKKQSKK